MARMAKRVGAVSVALAAVLAVGGGGVPAGADYAPYAVILPEIGPPGTEVQVGNDSAGGCRAVNPDTQAIDGAPGRVVVEIGTLAQLPPIGGAVDLDAVLASAAVDADDDGNWSVRLRIPDDVAPGSTVYATAGCFVDEPDPNTFLYDYYPAAFEVISATTEVPATSSIPEAPAPTAPPASAVEGDANFTG